MEKKHIQLLGSESCLEQNVQLLMGKLRIFGEEMLMLMYANSPGRPQEEQFCT